MIFFFFKYFFSCDQALNDLEMAFIDAQEPLPSGHPMEILFNEHVVIIYNFIRAAADNLNEYGMRQFTPDSIV